MQVEGIAVTTAAFERTVRLVTTARLRESVLAPLVDTEDEATLLAEIESATSARQLAETRGLLGLATNELVHDVPHARFINASFAYAKPGQPSRFSGAQRGAWYAALEVRTCLSEVGFHLTQMLAETGQYAATVEYAEMLCSLAGAFMDLRPMPEHPALGADIAVAYPIGNGLAEAARRAGLNGIIYPSVRHAGGTCIAALRPAAVQSVRQASVYRMIWRGRPEPEIEGPL